MRHPRKDVSRIEILRQYAYEDVNETEYEAVAIFPASQDLAIFACPKCHNDIHLNVKEHTITIADGKVTIEPDVYCRRCNKYIIVEKSRLEMVPGKSDLELGTIGDGSEPVGDLDDEDDDDEGEIEMTVADAELTDLKKFAKKGKAAKTK